ncbi:hypothetical protein VZT92_026286 [Zoarces viviparus]|uniref:Uncharacterized protein n=1 Tax=Zoarces viviparus TaxID=48416 RepID=A0AAW1DZ27_ZOAVI
MRSLNEPAQEEEEEEEEDEEGGYSGWRTRASRPVFQRCDIQSQTRLTEAAFGRTGVQPGSKGSELEEEEERALLLEDAASI